MSTVQPTRAPFQLEKLSNEQLLGMYCQTREDAPFLALWERLTDKNDPESISSQLKKKSRYICPRGSDPNWIFLGSFTRTYYRFKEYACNYCGRVDTPDFKHFLRWVVYCSIIDEYRFEKGPHQDEIDQLGNLGLEIDDTGQVIRGDKKAIDLYNETNEDRQADEEQVLANERVNGGHDGDAE